MRAVFTKVDLVNDLGNIELLSTVTMLKKNNSKNKDLAY